MESNISHHTCFASNSRTLSHRVNKVGQEAEKRSDGWSFGGIELDCNSLRNPDRMVIWRGREGNLMSGAESFKLDTLTLASRAEW